MSSLQKPWIGVSSLVLATILYGSFALLTRIIGFTIPILFGGVVRNLVGAMILLIPLALNRTFRRMSRRDLGWLTLRAAIGVVGFVGTYYSLFYLTIGTAYFIIFGSATITSFILGKLLFGEKPNKVTYFALILALVGLWLIYSISIDGHLIRYVWLALIGGVGSSGWSVLAKKIANDYSATQINGLDSLFFALFAAVFSLGMREVWVMPTLTVPWLGILIFMILFLFTGNLIVYGFKHLDAHRGSLILLLEIVFGIIVGAIFFHETLTPTAWIGGGLIMAAAAIPELHAIWVRPRQNK